MSLEDFYNIICGIMWAMGAWIVKGFGWTLLAVFFPPYAYYICIDWLIKS